MFIWGKKCFRSLGGGGIAIKPALLNENLSLPRMNKSKSVLYVAYGKYLTFLQQSKKQNSGPLSSKMIVEIKSFFLFSSP